MAIKKGHVSLKRFASANEKRYVPVQKELERKAKRSHVNKYRRIKRREGQQIPLPAVYEELYSENVQDEVSFLPNEKSQKSATLPLAESVPPSRALGYGTAKGAKAKKAKLSDRYGKQRKEYEARLAQQAEEQQIRANEAQQRLDASLAAQRKRRETRRAMQTRTRHGQPVLGKQVDVLLAKLEAPSSRRF